VSQGAACAQLAPIPGIGSRPTGACRSASRPGGSPAAENSRRARAGQRQSVGPRARLWALAGLLLLCIAAPLGRAAPARGPGQAADASLETLLAAIEADGEFVAEASLLELAQSCSPAAWSWFQQALARLRSGATRARLLAALSGFAEAEPGLAAEVEALLEARLEEKQADPREQAAAVRALARFSPAARERLGDRLLGRGSAESRAAALAVLSETDPELLLRLSPALLTAARGEWDQRVPAGKRGENLPLLRERVFAATRAQQPAATIESALDDKQSGLRRLALEEWLARGSAGALERCQRTFADASLPPEERALAGRLWAFSSGGEALEPAFSAGLAALRIEDFDARSERHNADRRTALEFAQELGALADPRVAALAGKELAKSEGVERLFRLDALGSGTYPELAAALDKCLDDRALSIQERAAPALARAKGPAGLPGLIARLKDPYLAGLALSVASEGYAQDAKLAEWLRALPGRERRPELVRAALGELAEAGHLARAELERALSSADFSDQLAAVRALGRLRRPESIELLVAALPGFGQRVLPDAVALLGELSGQPFGEVPELWARWYEERGRGQVPLSAERAAEIRATRLDLAEETSTASSEFFGIRLRGERIVFAIDVSGSMAQPTAPDGTTTDPELRGASRMEVAKAELSRALKALPEAVAFDVITFDSSVRSFGRGPEPATPARLKKALEFVARLRPGSQTNLWDALERALGHADVDTLVVLSDGEPNVGGVVQPAAILKTFAARNRWRGIRVHAIAFGLELGVLEGLARQSGGLYRYLP
jgi:hypothetical protein